MSGTFWPTIALGTFGGFLVLATMGFGWRSQPASDAIHFGRLRCSSVTGSANERKPGAGFGIAAALLDSFRKCYTVHMAL